MDKLEAQKAMDAAQSAYEQAAAKRAEASSALKAAKQAGTKGDELKVLVDAFEVADDALEAAGKQCRTSQADLRSATDAPASVPAAALTSQEGDPNATQKRATTAGKSEAPPAASRAQAESAADAATAAADEVDKAKRAQETADAAVIAAQVEQRKAAMALNAATRRAQEAANLAKTTGELTLKEGEAFVACWVPKSFVLTLDDNHRVTIKQGLRKLPASVVDHWYVKANGVTKQED